MNKENDIMYCSKCGSYMFEPVAVLLWRTKLANPGLKEDGWAAVQTFRCVNCKHVERDMDPTLEVEENDSPQIIT